MPERSLRDNKARQRDAYNRCFLEYERATARVHEMLRPYTIDRWGPACEGKDVLDVGCGTAYVLRRLLRAGITFGTYTGLDLSDEMIARNREVFRETPGVEFLVDDAEVLEQVAGRQFDVAISFGCLHHLERPEAAVGRLGACLREGGAFMAVELNRTHPASSFLGLYCTLLGVDQTAARRLVGGAGGVVFGHRAQGATGTYALAHPGHPGKRTPAEYRMMLRAAGFRRAEVRSLYLDLLPYGLYTAWLPLFRGMVAVSRPLLEWRRLRDAGSVLVMTARK